MKELFQELIIKIFHIETYRSLAVYLMDENQRLEKEIKDLKDYIKLVTTDIDEIDLEDIPNEAN